MTQFMLTTIDNPFNPFEQFDEWFRFDKDYNYNCCEYLARIANLSDDLSEEEENLEIERAIDEIIRVNPLNIYKKVSRTVKETV